MKLIEVNFSNRFLINEFLNNAGDSLITFRYFNTRNIEIIKNHLVTYVLRFEDKIVAYGHLDKEGDFVWLGIAVAESYKGKGLGRMMMAQLIEYAKINNLSRIDLSVDVENRVAQKLYEILGFVQYNTKDNVCYYRMTL
jgi:ribosomal protein S18 acetylase RimI-like enzyme